jgi:diacylglycerol kinase family enzyme
MFRYPMMAASVASLFLVRKIARVSLSATRLEEWINRKQKLAAAAYMVLIANMPYLRPRIAIAYNVSCRYSRLDMFVLSEMTKLDIISFAVQSAAGPVEGAHVKHYQLEQLRIKSRPSMPALADGVVLGKGSVRVKVHPRALRVIAGNGGGLAC